MRIHIITSSYPADPHDTSGTAGLFVRQFALELADAGHTVIVQPVARKQRYIADPEIIIEPMPWHGGDRELASMNFMNPVNWFYFLLLFFQGAVNTRRINKEHAVDRVLCMWALPAGVFGLTSKWTAGLPYDVWALGSDIWKIRRIPVLGRGLLRVIMQGADRVFADGFQLCREVTSITGVCCDFLATSRKLPTQKNKVEFKDGAGVKHFLYVGRYHVNKGPDLFLEAVALLPEQSREKIRVHMYGLGPMEEDLRKRLAALHLEPYVRLNGPIDAQDMVDCLNAVDYLVIPSRIESIPVVFSDALQTGTPVVAMPVGDLPRMIEETGCGLVADDISAEALSAALAAAMQADTRIHSINAAHAYERFDIRVSAARWLAPDVVSPCAARGEQK